MAEVGDKIKVEIEVVGDSDGRLLGRSPGSPR